MRFSALCTEKWLKKYGYSMLQAFCILGALNAFQNANFLENYINHKTGNSPGTYLSVVFEFAKSIPRLEIPQSSEGSTGVPWVPGVPGVSWWRQNSKSWKKSPGVFTVAESIVVLDIHWGCSELTLRGTWGRVEGKN